MRPSRTASVLLGAAVLGLAAAPTSAQVTGAAKKKPKPVVCRTDQLRLVVGTKVSCRAFPTDGAGSDPRLAYLRAVLQRNQATLRTRRGARVPSIWRAAGGRAQRIRSRLIRALPRILAVAGSRTATASAVGHSAGTCDSLPAGKATADGFSMSLEANGDAQIDVKLNDGYAIAVTIVGAVKCNRLELPKCPQPDGTLDGTDAHATGVRMRITKGTELVQLVSTVVRSTETLHGQVEDDAKLHALKVVSVAAERTDFKLPQGAGSIALSVRSEVNVTMPGGTPQTPRVQVGIATTGGFDQAAVNREADKAKAGYAQSVLEIVKEEISNYRSRETAWQPANVCATATFDPVNDTRRLHEDDSGQVKATVQDKGGIVAAKAKWTVSGQRNGTIGPAAAAGAAPSFTYVVTRAGAGIKLSGTFRVTSTAGVAEETWTQLTEAEPGPAYYVIDAVSYDANHSSTSTKTDNGICDVSGSVTESLVLNTPRPFDPQFNRLTTSGGAFSGSITLDSAAPPARRNGVVHGCDISQNPPPPACDTNVDLDVPAQIGVIVDIAANSSDAKLTWILPSVVVGDSGPGFPCYTPTFTAVPDLEKRTVPADDILKPGTHKQTVTRNLNFSAPFGHVMGVTGASITFHRVNADGSAYTG